MPFERNYDTVKQKIKRANSVCVYDVTIAGEGVAGTFALGYFLTHMRLHIINDTFHPFLFRYLCGASVGSLIIDILLKIWFLYDTQPDKQLTIDFIDVLSDNLTFEMFNAIFTTVDYYESLSPSNSYKLLTNFATTGGLLSRAGIIGLIRMTDQVFDKFRPYFNTSAFFKWRKPKLNNVFIAVQSTETSVSSIFSGNWRLFKTESKLITFKKLTNNNFEHVILCSTGLPILFEPLRTDGTDTTIDGALLMRNLMHIPQILHNFSYYNNVEQVFSPILDYFNINANDFVIHNDVVNIQTYFETVPVFSQFQNKPLNVLWSLLNRPYRQMTASNENYELTSIACTQPFIDVFSTVDANDIKGVSYEYSTSILNLPENKNKILEMSVRNPVDLDDFSLIISNLPLSSYIYDSRTFLHRGCTIRLVDTNTFVRTLYMLPPYFVFFALPFNRATEDNKNTIKLLLRTGIIQSNVMYDIYNKRMGMKWSKLSKTIQTAYDNFLGDRIYSWRNDINR